MSHHPHRVLVADADVASRKSLSWHLQDRGHVVLPASSGADVLVQCDIEPPDMIVMDRNLADMDGFDVCVRLRQDPRLADAIVILTAEPADVMTKAYLAKMVEYVGGDYFFARPYDVHLVVRLIDDVVRSPRREDAPFPVLSPTRVVWPTSRSRRTMMSC